MDLFVRRAGSRDLVKATQRAMVAKAWWSWILRRKDLDCCQPDTKCFESRRASRAVVSVGNGIRGWVFLFLLDFDLRVHPW